LNKQHPANTSSEAIAPRPGAGIDEVVDQVAVPLEAEREGIDLADGGGIGQLPSSFERQASAVGPAGAQEHEAVGVQGPASAEAVRLAHVVVVERGQDERDLG